MKNIITVFLVFGVLFSSFASNPDAVIAQWYTTNNKAKVEIYKKDNKYHGKIVWLKTPLDEKGNPKVDKNNPDAKLRTQPIIGMNLIKDFVYDGEKTWSDGEIYDPESGKTYSCNMKLNSKGELEVRGYIGISLIGRTEIWKKAN